MISNLPIGGIGGGLSFGVSLIADILGALFGGLFGGPSTSQINAALNQLRNSFSRAIDTVTRFAWTIATAFGKLLGMIHDLLVGFLDGLWELVKKLAGILTRVMKEVLPAIAKAIRITRQTLNDLYKNWIRPLLNYIQIVRRYLAILRLFHVKWAGKLDQVLTNIQGRIVGPFLYVLRTLNGIGNWVNVILTAGAILQRPVFINTMYAYQRDWINLWWQGQAQAGNAGASGAPLAGTGPPSNAQVFADFQAFATADAGPYAVDAQRADTTLQQTLATQ